MADAPSSLADALRDRYLLERELGRGGMATVYLARDLKHERPVALKVLLPEPAASLGPDRFQREIKLAARLQHPHILTVHDSGEAAGQLWFTMPYVEGESLRDRLRREQQLPVDEALRITREAALALEYAHRQGVIHRDIKPENLLLTKDGSTLVADFGIARALGARRAPDPDRDRASGRPAYMSPEQADGTAGATPAPTSTRSACVLYEMLAGGRPSPARPRGDHRQVVHGAGPERAGRAARACRSGVDLAIQRAPSRSRRGPVRHDGRVRPGAARSANRIHARSDSRRLAGARGGRPLGRLPAAAVALGLGVLVAGALFAWRRTARACERGAGPRLLAVLPFENLGDSADAYFADGVAEAVRGKLSQPRGSGGHRPRQLQPVPAHHEGAAGDRARAGRRLPADGHGAMGEGAGRREPGSGHARAGGRGARARPAHAVAGFVRCLADRRVPGPSRHRDDGGRCARRGPG